MRRTKEDSEKTRTAILLAAEELFLEKGVSHTSLEQIARAAGVTRGAVYWHFQNKAHLFNEMLNQVRLPPEQLTERLSGCDGSDPLRSLYDLCLEAVQSLLTQEKKRRILTILMQRCDLEDLHGIASCWSSMGRFSTLTWCQGQSSKYPVTDKASRTGKGGVKRLKPYKAHG